MKRSSIDVANHGGEAHDVPDEFSDALHAATALSAGSAFMLTNDSGFRRVPGLSLVLLSEVAAVP